MGAFDDLIPSQSQPQASSGMFDDLIPSQPKEPTWAETFATAKHNLPSPTDFLKSELTHNPLEDVKHLGKLALGLGEKAVGSEPYGNEKKVADEFINHYSNYLSESGWKKNISEDPIGTLSDVLNVAVPSSRIAANTVGRVVTPIPARAGFEEAAQVLRREGVPQTAGQRTGNERLKFAESELGGARTSDILDRQKEAYTAAASRRIGEDTPHLGPQELEASYHRIGGGIGNIAQRNVLQPDPGLIPEVTNVVNEYHNLIGTPAPIVQRYADFISQRTRAGTAPLSGATYQAMRSRLGRYAREAQEPYLRRAMYGLQNALDDSFERGLQASGNGADYAALQDLRRQYGNYLTLENTMRTGAGDTARGLVTPPKLEQAASSGSNRRRYAHGQSDFTDLAKAGRVGMSPMPNSGTPARVAAQAIPAAIGGALGFGGGGGLGAVAGGIAGKIAAGRALMSAPVQGYLGNQLLPGRATFGLGRVAPVIAATVQDRNRNLQRAGQVMSEKVLDDAKRTSPKELAAWINDPSPDNARKLAEAVTKRLKEPKLADRLTAELSSGQ